jgi:hypothetical protein
LFEFSFGKKFILSEKKRKWKKLCGGESGGRREQVNFPRDKKRRKRKGAI